MLNLASLTQQPGRLPDLKSLRIDLIDNKYLGHDDNGASYFSYIDANHVACIAQKAHDSASMRFFSIDHGQYGKPRIIQSITNNIGKPLQNKQ